MPATVYFDVKSIQELRRSSGDSISTADRMKSSRVHDLQSEVAPMKPDEKGKMKRRDSWGTAVYAVLNGSHPGTLCVCVRERMSLSYQTRKINSHLKTQVCTSHVSKLWMRILERP